MAPRLEQQLCIDLLRADTEEQVIGLLRKHGYWDDPAVWCPFGRREDNFSTIGNQSSSADGALVEKLVNSVDAVLMGECLSAGVRPNSAEAPRSIQEAVARFFQGDASKANTLGHGSDWSQDQRRRIADRITLAATGSRQCPSFTIVDSGEGQTPNSMPDTLLSLDQQNKINVHFVQGKFNMGGTGALRFCGHDNLQLVVSRRNPNIPSENSLDGSSGQWGFTVVRREDPTDAKRVSTYKYLAPGLDGVLRFSAEALPLFPQGNDAYSRDNRWGTAIKLYEYKIAGRSHILRRDGLLYRLDILLPGIALPIRLHECRDYEGHHGSFDTTLNGVNVRLSYDRNENLEPGFPTSSTLVVSGQQMTAEIYAFKKEKADSYRKREGLVFTVNGQTHGSIPRTFFSRRSVGMSRLEDSILVIVDCSQISGRSREDLFMNSRDRMERGELLSAIESELESILRNHQTLRELRERRRHEDIESKLQNSKAFQDVLESIVRKSPALSALFGSAGPLSDPFKSKKVKAGNAFRGKDHPSIFRFRDKNYGQELNRITPINMRSSRIAFETDVVNDYFSRKNYPGEHLLRLRDQRIARASIPDHTINLQNGIATLKLALPSGASVGDAIRYELVVEDETLVEPFVNPFVISVGPPQENSGGNGGRRRRSDNGNGGGETFQGLAIPAPIPVTEPEWNKHNFDKYSALKATYDPPDNEEEAVGSYTYYINMDNIFLNTELKATKENPEVVKSRWQYGMVLIGMALLREQVSDSGVQRQEERNEETAEEKVYNATAAIAPVLLPLIEHLGALSDEDVVS